MHTSQDLASTSLGTEARLTHAPRSAPLDLSKYATAELKLVVDIDHYAVRDEAYRRSPLLAKKLTTAEKQVTALQEELKECGLAIDAASAEARRLNP